MTPEDWFYHYQPIVAAWKDICLEPNYKILVTNLKALPYELFRFRHFEDGVGIVYMNGAGRLKFTGAAENHLKGRL